MNENIVKIKKKQKIVAIVFLAILALLVVGIIISFFIKKYEVLKLLAILFYGLLL